MKVSNQKAVYLYFWLPVLILLFLIPVLGTSNYTIRFMTTLVMFAALGQAWNIVGGLGNQVSLGHAAYFGLGAYCSAILFQQYGISPWIGMLCGALLSAILASAISYPTFRLRGPYFALATLAVAEVIQILATHMRGLTGGAMGIYLPFKQESWLFLQFRNIAPYYYIMLCAFIVITAIFIVIERSTLGLKLRALRHDETAALSVGVNVFRSKFAASVISASLTAVIGSVYAHFQAFVDPSSVFGLVSISVMIAMVTIVGGLGRAAGPLVGAAILIPTQEVMQRVAGANPGYSMLLFGLLLIVIILLSPNGIASLFDRFRDRRARDSSRAQDQSAG